MGGGGEQGKEARTKSNLKACVIHKFITGSVSLGQTYLDLLGIAKFKKKKDFTVGLFSSRF